MKRIGAILCLSALIVTLSTAFCFAGTFSIDKTYPTDGQSETSIDNLCVKIYLHEGTTMKESLEKEKDKFSVTDEKGTKVPLKILYDEKNNVVLVLAYDSKSNKTDSVVESDTDYTFEIEKGLVDDEGNILAIDKEFKDKNGNYSITFKTQNQGRNTRINMYMMVAMFGGIFIFSSRSMKKQKEEEKNGGKKKSKVNPYEEAKRTGKSVEEIVAKQQKEAAKEAAKEAKKAAENKKLEEEYDKQLRDSYYKVSGPRPIAAAGGQYKSGRNAIAEAEEKKDQAAKNNSANNKKKKK